MRFLICATFANNASLPRSTTKMMASLKSPPARFQLLRSWLGHSHAKRRTICIGILVTALAYGAFLWSRSSSVAGGSDSSGYFNSARLIGAGRAVDEIRAINGLTPPDWHYYYQQPLGFSAIGDQGSMAPTYPIGLPLMLLAAKQIGGWNIAGTIVNMICALGCGVLMTALGREFCGLRTRWLILGLSLLLLCPLFVFFSLQAMSDVPATFCALLVFYAAAKSARGWGWALIAGAATGLAVLVRPTNVLLAGPALILLALSWRAWLGYVAAGLPFAVVQLLYNRELYGDALTSGYGDVFALFKAAHFPHNSVHFARWIPQLLTPVIALSLGLPWLLRERARVVSSLGLWCVLLIGFYVFYYHSGETWWYLRFILPAFPCLILLAMMTAQKLSVRWTSDRRALALCTVILIATAGWQAKLNKTLHAADVSLGESAYTHTTDWLKNNAPHSAIMAAMQMSGALHFYTEFPLLRYDLIPPDHFAQAVAAARQNGQEIYAPLFPFELERVVDARLGGEWEKIATVDYITIWRLKH